MTPDFQVSIRSMVSQVFPVFVGPSTAVTRLPRSAGRRGRAPEETSVIASAGFARVLNQAALYHNDAGAHAFPRVFEREGNESRPNR